MGNSCEWNCVGIFLKLIAYIGDNYRKEKNESQSESYYLNVCQIILLIDLFFGEYFEKLDFTILTKKV